MADSSRQKEMREIRKEYPWVYPLIWGSALLGIGIWIGGAVFADDPSGYGMNLFTEFVGIGATVFIIDQLRVYRNKENLKQQT